MEIPRHREVNMMDSPFAEEIKEVIVQLFRKDNTNEIEEWEALTPIELGVLSWHLGNSCADALSVESAQFPFGHLMKCWGRAIISSIFP